ncbi:hypothetical protein DL96DRAFT_369082 [Flagelloscypha sp. PMI_526]|nr:hypothetical protein DL96DRAFT_369082 [Flagelloscypha sp. PMI_526]
MEQCLQIPELREAICVACRSSSLTTLARLAATSTMFHWPAIKELWSSATLKHLIMLSPAARFPWGEHHVKLKRPWAPSDWDRFLHYSIHVKALFAYHSGIDVNRLHQERIMESMISTMPLKLFPRLIDLNEKIEYPLLQIFGTQIFTPQLLRVTMRHDAITDHLLRPCSQLQTLSYAPHNSRRGEYMLSMNRIISWHPQLTSIVLQQMDLALFMRLAALPSLTFFRIESREALTENLPKSILLDSSFPQLVDLDFTDNFHNVVGILGAASASPLQALQFRVSGILPDSEMWRDTFSCLFPWSKTLMYFKVPTTHPESSDDSTALLLHTLRPLLSLYNLRFLSLQRRVNLLDTDMDDFAAAFPQLAMIQLSSPDGNSSLTLRSLVPFAWYCPNLFHIDIELNAEGWKDVHLSLQRRPSNNQQEVVLDASKYRIQNGTGENVLHALLDMFPNAVQVYGSWSLDRLGSENALNKRRKMLGYRFRKKKSEVNE